MFARAWQFYQDQRPRVAGVILVGGGIAVAVWTGIRSSSTTHPPSTTELVVLLAATSVLQLVGGVAFGRIGRVEPQKAKGAVRTLFRIGSAIRMLRSNLEVEPDGGVTGDLIRKLVATDTTLALIAVEVEDAIQDWNDVYAEALASVLRDHQSVERAARR